MPAPVQSRHVHGETAFHVIPSTPEPVPRSRHMPERARRPTLRRLVDVDVDFQAFGLRREVGKSLFCCGSGGRGDASRFSSACSAARPRKASFCCCVNSGREARRFSVTASPTEARKGAALMQQPRSARRARRRSGLLRGEDQKTAAPVAATRGRKAFASGGLLYRDAFESRFALLAHLWRATTVAREIDEQPHHGARRLGTPPARSRAAPEQTRTGIACRRPSKARGSIESVQGSIPCCHHLPSRFT